MSANARIPHSLRSSFDSEILRLEFDLWIRNIVGLQREHGKSNQNLLAEPSTVCSR